MTSYDFALQQYNTFGIDATCTALTRISNLDDLMAVDLAQDYLILGGGSNILCADYIPAHLLKNEIMGISVVSEDADHVLLRVGGGEVWNDLVATAVAKGWGGLENLTLIPGTVGAAPVQNIGAYGVEQDQLMVELSAFDLRDGVTVDFDVSECDFGYRDSLFKSKQKGRYFITHVTYRLTKRNHILNISYGAIEEELADADIQVPTIATISSAVAAIRVRKLPDPSMVANAGSFFKNPVVYQSLYRELVDRYPDLVYYPMPDGTYKIPAGWLIDQCGYRGKRVGDTGTYEHQALVIVNHGSATGAEIWNFANDIQRAVMDRYGVLLVPEVNRWGFIDK